MINRSTESTVREAIVLAIQGISKTHLGFDHLHGNVKDYPLEFEHPEKRLSYLSTLINNKKTIRCWSVDVTSEERVIALSAVTEREYTAEIKGYYEIGRDGEGYKLIVDHNRFIRQALLDFSTKLNGVADILLSIGTIEVGLESANDADLTSFIVSRTSWRYLKKNPFYF